MLSSLPVTTSGRLPQLYVERAYAHADRIRTLVRTDSPTLTTQCRQAGLPLELAELCGGLLASVVEDLVTASRLPRTDFERAKRMERVLTCAEEPAASALRIAIAASPVNGRAIARHWDTICARGERGKLAWLLGLQGDDNAYTYGKQVERRQ
jgi:hypothetical protein